MKLAIVGAGMIVKDFLTISKDLPEIELVAISGTDKDKQTMNELQESYGITQVYTDFTDCLEKSEADTVYVALPNVLHYSFTKQALLAGKNVICEKPFTLTLAELTELESIATEKGKIVLEAITNQYLSNYQAIKASLPKLGEVKVIDCNYSQYSSRYDLFKEGTILPAFDPRMGGGALMDINIYNIHFVVGLYGMPQSVRYFPNMEQGIDTSGVLVMDYGHLKAICTGAKDSSAASRSTIQGNKGTIVVEGPTNTVPKYSEYFSKMPVSEKNEATHAHRMFDEFRIFNQVIDQMDRKFATARMTHSKQVMQIVEWALQDAGIVLGKK
ncbi:MAG: Gfo/Idh/MocA family protein [Enterococcus sp.]